MPLEIDMSVLLNEKRFKKFESLVLYTNRINQNVNNLNFLLIILKIIPTDRTNLERW